MLKRFAIVLTCLHRSLESLFASPLLEGWYRVQRICLIPLAFVNVTNSLGVNCVPLSDTNCCGSPYCANTVNNNCLLWGGSTHFDHLRPLRVPVDENQKHFPLEWPSKVHVNSLPGARRPEPGMKWCNSRLAFHCLATDTWLSYLLQLLVYLWPPRVASRNGFHPDNTRVFSVQLLQHLVLQLWDNSYSPHHTRSFNGQFMASIPIWLHTFFHIIGPFCPCVLPKLDLSKLLDPTAELSLVVHRLELHWAHQHLKAPLFPSLHEEVT